MPVYRCRFVGRKLGAIGIFYPICETVTANDEHAATMALNERFEHISGLRIEPLTPSEHVDAINQQLDDDGA